MSGDISRDTFLNALNEGYSRVRMQQGRPQLDADWNEQVELTHHRHRTIARDAFGPAGVPTATPDGFLIVAGTNQSDFSISAGRMYVDGLLVENDRARTYLNQPFVPNPDSLDTIIPENNPVGLVFLRVFERDVTALEDDRLRERALLGADTTTRVKTVWQAVVIALPDGTSPDAIRRMVADGQPLGFLVPAPTTGALEARVVEPAAADPARSPLVGPEAGYLAQENQLYRVEVHNDGDRSTTTIKWSSENASVMARVAPAGGNELVLEDDPRVNEGDFPTGGWVELIHRASEDAGVAGHLARLNRPAGQRGITLDPPPPQNISTLENPRLRRWDQQGPFPALDNGVPVTDDWINLGNGIQVRFSSGTYQSGEYWLIPARAATGTIEWPPAGQSGDPAAPVRPFGGNVHVCPLALINRNGSPLQNGDLRPLAQSLTNLRSAQTTQIITVAPMLVPIEPLTNFFARTPNFERAWFHRLGYAFAPFNRDAEGWMSLQLPHGAQIRSVRCLGRNQSVATLTLSLLRHEIALEEEQVVATGTVSRIPQGPAPFEFDQTVAVAPDLQLIDNERFRYIFYAFLDRPGGGGARDPAVWIFTVQITCTTG